MADHDLNKTSRSSKSELVRAEGVIGGNQAGEVGQIELGRPRGVFRGQTRVGVFDLKRYNVRGEHLGLVEKRALN